MPCKRDVLHSSLLLLRQLLFEAEQLFACLLDSRPQVGKLDAELLGGAAQVKWVRKGEKDVVGGRLNVRSAVVAPVRADGVALGRDAVRLLGEVLLRSEKAGEQVLTARGRGRRKAEACRLTRRYCAMLQDKGRHQRLLKRIVSAKRRTRSCRCRRR